MAQQVMMGRLLRRNEQNEEMYLMDIWDGYPHERDELLARLKAEGTANPIVLTGDIHSNWVNNILSDFSKESSEIIATEFVGTSITSGGDGSDISSTTAQTLSDNSHSQVLQSPARLCQLSSQQRFMAIRLQGFG